MVVRDDRAIKTMVVQLRGSFCSGPRAYTYHVPGARNPPATDIPLRKVQMT